MNDLARRIRFWRKPRAQVSRIETVLPRIRAIREQCDWQPSTSASAVQRRRERVHSARRRIVYNPVPYEPGLEEWRLPVRQTWWLWLAGAIAVLCFSALLWGLALTNWSRQSSSQGFRYQLPATPPFLTESLALAKASESLIRATGHNHRWLPEESPKPAKAPDGTPDRYLFRYDPANANVGSFTFSTAEQTHGTWTVHVQLTGNILHCTVSPRTFTNK
jgi:hypothetical protein